MHRVMIHPASYQTCQQAVDRAFELFPQQIQGRKVVIKPNVLRISKADEHIVTHPSLLRAVVDKVASMSPSELIVGDNPGLFAYGQNKTSFEASGLLDAARGYYRNLGDFSTQLDFNPEFLPHVGVSTAIMEADILISLPKFKTHGLTVITGAIKNSYGILPGAQKARLHQIAGSPERFHELIVDVFRLRIPDLFIMDAVIGMEGNGPASPDLREVGMVLASDNGVAMDAVVARMMGLDPAVLGFLRKARNLGLGTFESDHIEIDGELPILPDFVLPPISGLGIANNPAINEMMQAKTRLLPRADSDLCTTCGACIDQCPASALYLAGDIPRVHEDRCITCFCCQEICPEKAMTLQ
jgi:uncharacterized protein (DUF362 family)/NAD-dependent dihydropyrimidine dehydrogenase PreA subunit